jgi:hypothetical protein
MGSINRMRPGQS